MADLELENPDSTTTKGKQPQATASQFDQVARDAGWNDVPDSQKSPQVTQPDEDMVGSSEGTPESSDTEPDNRDKFIKKAKVITKKGTAGKGRGSKKT